MPEAKSGEKQIKARSDHSGRLTHQPERMNTG
jgi:hypothetical protein